MRTTAIFLLALLASASIRAQKYEVEKLLKIGGTGGWDYIAVHNNFLYVSHGTQVNVIDKNTGDSVAVIPNTTGVHGIAFDDAVQKGFTSNGRLNNVYVFNPQTNIVTDSIATGQNPDAIMYEPFSKTIITCNGKSKDLSVIDPVNNKVVATIPVAGKPETAVSNGKGSVYVNIEDKNMIAVIDMHQMKMTETWNLNGVGPTGLVLDVETNRLFSGCDDKLIVTDAASGKEIKQVPIGAGCDGVCFDADSKTIFTSNGESGTITIIKEESANSFKVITNLNTKISGRTITIDNASHKVFIPCADMEKNTPAGQWPKAIPGTFGVLVIKLL